MISILETRDALKLELDDDAGRLSIVDPSAELVAFELCLRARVRDSFAERSVVAEGLAKEACSFLLLHVRDTPARHLRFLIVRARCAATVHFPRS